MILNVSVVSQRRALRVVVSWLGKDAVPPAPSHASEHSLDGVVARRVGEVAHHAQGRSAGHRLRGHGGDLSEGERLGVGYARRVRGAGCGVQDLNLRPSV